MGFTGTIMPQTTLDNNTFFATTDLLIISSGVINIPSNRVTMIQNFLQTGKPCYIQAEYLPSYDADQAFQTIVTNLGGTFAWGGTTAGTLQPMNELGTFATTNLAVSPLTYFWYGCYGTGGCSIMNMLEFQGQYFGFQYCSGTASIGALSTTSDQDWVNQSTSTTFMQNILTHLINAQTLCITSGNGPIVNLGPDTTLCTGAQLILNATNNGSTYLWQNGSTSATFTVTAPGNYFVAVTNGCGTGHDTINVSFTNPPTVNLGNDTTLCLGNALTLNAGNPGATYLWSNGATTQTISVTTSATYWVNVNPTGCGAIDSIIVNFVAAPVVNLGNDTTLCATAPITLDAGNAGASYLWSNGATTQTITPTVNGSYWVVAAIGTCVDQDTITLTFSPAPVVSLGNDTTLCNGQNLTLNAGNAGATFLWSTAEITQTISVNTTGTYSVEVNPNGCTGYDTIVVTFVPAPVVTLGNDITVCIGIPVTLDAGNAGASFLWSNGAITQTISPVTSGNYWVIASIGTCIGRDTIAVTFTPLPVVNLGTDQMLCTPQTLLLNANNPGDTYLWSTGSITQTITVATAGTYWVQVSSGTCIGSDTIVITTSTAPNVNLGPDVQICYGHDTTFDAGNPGLSFRWSTGATTQTIKANATGDYFVNVNNNGCITTDTVHLIVGQPLMVSLGADTFICPGTDLMIDAGIGFVNYYWSPIGGNTHFIHVDQPGTYNVIVSDIEGCTTASSKFVREFCPTDIYLPNAFTPNGNMMNDYFMAIGDGVLDFHIVIFNRWGELIFESTDIGTGWDGTYNGADCPEGLYIYRVDFQKYDFLELKKHTKVGNVNLIR